MAISPTSPVPHISKDFVSLHDNFGYAQEIERALQAIRQFEIRTSRYCVFYAKYFGKEGKTVTRAAIRKTLSVLGTKSRPWPRGTVGHRLEYACIQVRLLVIFTRIHLTNQWNRHRA